MELLALAMQDPVLVNAKKGARNEEAMADSSQAGLINFRILDAVNRQSGCDFEDLYLACPDLMWL